MSSKRLLIVFAKNIKLGKVKTRLAASIGDDGAFKVYKRLFEITEQEVNKLEDCSIHVYFSDVIIDDKFPNHSKFVQQGNDLGERMKNAFQDGFDAGFNEIIGIGTDLPDLSSSILLEGFNSLSKHDTVFGPAEDGGYYLIGMRKMHNCIFENKPWSTDRLLVETCKELDEKQISCAHLIDLNDVDTIEDLKQSSLALEFAKFC